MADALEQLQRQAQQARTEVQDWRRQQLASVSSEAEKLRREASRAGSEVEKEAQEQISTYRRAETGAKRAKEVGIKKSPLPYKKAAEAIEVERAKIIKQVTSGKKELAEAKAQSEAEIKKIADSALVDIEKQEKVAIEDYNAFTAQNIQLNSGEWIAKSSFENLNASDQSLLMKLGTVGFNQQKTSDYNKYLDDLYIQYRDLTEGTGQGRLGKTAFTTLSDPVKYMNHIIDRTYEKLGTGELVLKKDYNLLSAEEQGKLNQLGVSKYNDLLKKETADFEADNMIIGEYSMPLDDWGKLDKKYQDIALSQGFQSMNTAIDIDNSKINTAEANLKPYYLTQSQAADKLGGKPSDYDKEGTYNLSAIISSIKSGNLQLKEDAQLLFGKDTVTKAIQEAKATEVSGVKAWWRAMTPWDEAKGETATISQVGSMFADLFVPFVWTRNAKDMSAGQVALNTGLDLLILIPVAGWIGRSLAKTGVTAATKATGLITKELAQTLAKSKVTAKLVKETAKIAGKADKELVTAVKSLKATPLTSAKYAKVVSKAQVAINTSRLADKKFIEALSSLEQATKGQLGKFERLSGMEGLKVSVLNITKAQDVLNKTWAAADKLKFGSPEYIKQLSVVQKAKDALTKALENYANKTKVRFPEGKAPQFAGYSLKTELKPTKETIGDMLKAIEDWAESSAKPLSAGKTGKPALLVAEKLDITKMKPKPITRMTLKSEYKEVVEEITKPKAPKVKPTAKIIPKSISAMAALGLGAKPLTNTAYANELADAIATQVLAQTSLTTAEQANLKQGVSVATVAAIDAFNKAEAAGMTSTETKIATELALKAALKTYAKGLPATMAKAVTQTTVKQIAKVGTKTAVKTKAGVRILPIVILPDGSKHQLTEKELKGSVGWKQGFIYKMIFPPYGKNNLVNTKEPIPGVPYKEGLRSAYESIVILNNGKLPSVIARDMGIMDIRIITAAGKKPRIEFKRDMEQTYRTKKARLS